jgi:hypothetical protein
MPFSPQYRKNQRNGDGSLEIPANGPCHSANTLGVFAGVYSVDRVRQVDQEVSQHRTIPGRSIKRPKAGPQESKKPPTPVGSERASRGWRRLIARAKGAVPAAPRPACPVRLRLDEGIRHNILTRAAWPRRGGVSVLVAVLSVGPMPSCRAASTLAWPAIRPPSSPTSAGVVQPHSLMLAAIAAI